LNQEKKSAYDARLREQLDAIEGGQRLREQGQTPRTEQGSAALRRTKAPKNVASQESPTKKESIGSSTQKRSAKQSVANKSKAVSGQPTAMAVETGLPKIYLVAAGILFLFIVGGIGFWLLRYDASAVPDREDSIAANRAQDGQRKEPIDIPNVQVAPPLPSIGESLTEDEKQVDKKEGTKQAESEDSAEEQVNAESPQEELPEETTEETESEPVVAETPLEKKQPLGFIPLEIASQDAENSFNYTKNQQGFYASESKYKPKHYTLDINGSSTPLTGLCLEVTAPPGQTATLNHMEIDGVAWMDATDSLGQGGAATVIDKNKNAGWQLQFVGDEPVWAVFNADQPFGPKLLLQLRHSSNAQRLPRFRLWGITGSGTAEEMAQAMRDRKLAEKPFANFVAHGLPEGGTGEVGLGSVFVGKEKLAAQLFGGNSDAAGVSFSLKQIPPAVEDDLQRWEFLLRAGDKQTPVAELTQQEGKLAPLALRWLPAAVQLPEAAVLRNGLLQLRIAEHSRSVPLREVQKLAPLSYNPLKTVRPQIQVPTGLTPDSLRLALQFPQATFGIDGSAVLQVRGEDVETDILIKDDIVLKLDSSWKEPIITLSVKTQIQEEVEGKGGKQKTKAVPLKKVLSELPKLAARIEKGERLLEIFQRVEKYAGRSRLKPEEKREITMINKRWRDFGLNPRIILNEKQAETLVKIVLVEIEKIKNRRDQLTDLQQWVTQIGDAGAIEFRVYSLVDGVPLDLVRSTGWQQK
jgi:2-oxo-4-hydroxy-4-carboxy--5-ureidoimidazoline (OHCU) decarboxylase